MFADDVGASSQPHASPSFRLPPIKGQGQTPRSSANIYGRDFGYRPPEGEVDYVTNYQREYAKKSVTPVRQIRNDRMREEPARFEGEPTYSHDYRMWTSQQSPRREKIVRAGAYAPPTGRFQGSSNYTSDYIPHVVTPFRRGQKPGDTSRLTGDDPFDSTTAYSQSYVRYSLPRGEEGMTYGVSSMRGSKGKDVEPPPPLNEITNYQRDYTRKDITKQASMKPKAVPMMSDEPFDPTTTHKTSFKRWTMEKPYQHQPAQYVRPDGTMESMTTTRLHYDQKAVEKFVARRPANTRDVDPLGAFEGTSSYSDQYRGRQQQPDERARPLKRLGVGIGLGGGGGGSETARFDGQPTYREEYPAHVAHARQIPPRIEESGKELWPSQQFQGGDGGGGGEGFGFDSRTVYRDQFVQHPSPERRRREPVAYQPNTTAFDATTNYSVDFTTPDATGARQASFRPAQGGVMHCDNDGEARPRFDGTTSHHVDFQPYNYVSRPSATQAAAAEPETEAALSGVAEMNGDAGGPGDVTDGGLETSGAPNMAPRFKGHANYGFEYEKWAQQQNDKTSVAAL